MRNPWQHGQVPDDGAVRKSRPWVRLVGVLMWVIVITLAGVLILSGGEQAAALTIHVLQLTALTTALCIVGWLVQRLLRRLELLNGALASLFPLLFVLALPILVGLIAHQMGFLEGALSAEISKVAPVDRWQQQATKRAIGPIKDVLPWS